MNREMIRQKLTGAGPFTLRTSDGREYPVPHPEFVLIGRHNIVIEDTKGMLEILDPMHVVSISVNSKRKSPRSST